MTMTSLHNLLNTLWTPKDFKNRGRVHLPHKASFGLFTFFSAELRQGPRMVSQGLLDRSFASGGGRGRAFETDLSYPPSPSG